MDPYRSLPALSWKYKRVESYHSELDGLLDQFGAKGWELVSVVYLPYNWNYQLFFRQPVYSNVLKVNPE